MGRGGGGGRAGGPPAAGPAPPPPGARARGGGGARPPVERPVQQRPVGGLEFLAGIDPELVREHRPPVVVEVDGVRLPPGPAQGRHQLAPDALAQRELGDEPGEFAGDLLVPAEGEVRGDAVLQGDGPCLRQPRGLGVGEVFRGVRERLPVPPRQGVAQQLTGPFEVLFDQCLAAAERQLLEFVQVDGRITDAHGISRRSAIDHYFGAENLAQARNIGVELCADGGRGCPAPQQPAQPLVRHDLFAGQEERREHGVQLRPGERDPVAVPPYLYWPEHSEFHVPPHP
ncbi:hypothetical protein GCM10010215_06380 [Streptomyces virginiae]|nr:hypothetical protein GCM10010215_06380 [Streptomyces virginiae]